MSSGKKRILIDGTTISKKTDGLSQYILNTVAYLDADEFDVTLIVRTGECPHWAIEKFESKGITVKTVNIKPIGPLRDVQLGLYLLRNRKKFDLAFIPSNQFPVFIGIPTVYTIHDLIYEHYPQQLGRLAGLKKCYLHFVVKVGLRKAKYVIAVSENTKKDIIRIHSPKRAEKIVVVYEGWEHLTKYKPDVSAKLDVPFDHYILYVGSTRQHKNLDNLLLAIQKIKDRLPAGYGVVCVGNTSFFSQKQIDAINNINREKEIIHFTGWLTDEELSAYFKKSIAFIFPSLCEGFGIPVLEAFYYQIPLLLSNRSSLPEVAGDAALYFDPTDVDDMGEKILYFIENQVTLTDELVNKGTNRLNLFSWKSASKKICEYIHLGMLNEKC